MSEEEKPKTATELLLDLQNKVNETNQRLSTIEMGIKLILSQFKKQPQEITHQQADDTVFVKKGTIPVATEPIQPARANKPTTQPVNGKKVPVSQRVTWGNGQSLFMANVEIFDENDNFLEKVKTAADGKWSSKLPIGKVKIKINKKVIQDGNEVELKSSTTHTIQNTDSIVSLPLILIK